MMTLLTISIALLNGLAIGLTVTGNPAGLLIALPAFSGDIVWLLALIAPYGDEDENGYHNV